MKVLVVGASGFIGRHLVAALRERGDEVVATGRSRERLERALPGVAAVEWDPPAGPLPATTLEGVAGAVNLAGESVATPFWTAKKKEAIRASRVDGTRNLVAGIAGADPKPRVLVNASAVGYYGDGGHLVLHENSQKGRGFLADVCAEWEAAAFAAPVRVCVVRMGVVLGRDGGAYPKLRSLPGRAQVGDGRHWVPWVHVDDAVGVLLHALDREDVRGVFNATAPNPATNKEFMREIGRARRRPVLWAPKFALRMMGGIGQVATDSVHAIPLRTEASGYRFRFPDLPQALRSLEGGVLTQGRTDESGS